MAAVTRFNNNNKYNNNTNANTNNNNANNVALSFINSCYHCLCNQQWWYFDQWWTQNTNQCIRCTLFSVQTQSARDGGEEFTQFGSKKPSIPKPTSGEQIEGDLSNGCPIILRQ